MEAKTGVEVVQVPETKVEADGRPPAKILTPEERNDLRKFVLSGGKLSIEQARSVFETIRTNQGAAAITGEANAKKPRGKKKPGMTDEELAADLGSLGI